MLLSEPLAIRGPREAFILSTSTLAAGEAFVALSRGEPRAPEGGRYAAQDTFPMLVLQHAALPGERSSMREKEFGIWQTYSWRETAAAVRATACGLSALGMRRGDKIAIIGDNRPQFCNRLILRIGCFRLHNKLGVASPGNREGKSVVMNMSRRSVFRTSIGLATSGALARPYIANAQAKTAVVWQNQGFVRQEDEAFVKTVRDYEKASGNKIDLSVMPFMALGQKAVSALTTGEVPDLMFFDAPSYILPQNAWDDKLVDVSDVVEPYKSQMTESALLNSTFFNRATQKRSFYLVPIKQGATPFHIWGDLVEKAGFKMSDVPNSWNKVWEFFKPVQTELRKKGMRKIYGCGLQITTVGPNDGNNLFSHFLIANGGKDIVTPDGRLHTDDPQVREAAIRSVEFMTSLYRDGFVPPER
jgi:Bacterial extracellular solute-binding protein